MFNKIFSNIPSSRRIICACAIGIFTIVFSTTIGEFVIALHNRYSTYPTGWDTNMYGNSAAVSFVFVLIMSALIVKVALKKIDRSSLITGILLFLLLGVISSRVPNLTPKSWCKYELTIYSCQTYESWRYAESNLINP